MRPRTLLRGRMRSLQARLALLISLVLLLVTTVIGSVTIAVQSDNLLRRVDQQLGISLEMATGLTWEGSSGLWPNMEPDASSQEQRPVGPRFGSLNLTLYGGYVAVAEVVDEAGATITLNEVQIQELLDAVVGVRGPLNVNLNDLGGYRVIGVSTVGTAEPLVVVVGQSLAEVQRSTRSLISTFALAGLIGVLVASAASVWLVRRSLRPLEELRATAAHISDTPLSTGSVSLGTRVAGAAFQPRTEVGDLAESFNHMLDHVEDALVHRAHSEAKLKQFAADASHELRTPLSNVSGYAEFAARQSEDLPTDVAQSLERIRSESQRMSGIVEKLLLLARLDAAEPALADSSSAAVATLDSTLDARVTDPEKTWKLFISEEAAQVHVPLAPDLLHQAVANLTTNARIHTPPGTTVQVSLTLGADSFALIQVEDDGPGIPADLAPRVFDRFVRADSARTGVAENRSTGLGLAITQSLVVGAGGRVGVESESGRTVFSIYLPVVEDAK